MTILIENELKVYKIRLFNLSKKINNFKVKEFLMILLISVQVHSVNLQ